MTGIGLEGLEAAGLYGGTPLVLYDLNSLRSLVLSPLDNFKSCFQARPAFLDTDLSCGLHGR